MSKHINIIGDFLMEENNHELFYELTDDDEDKIKLLREYSIKLAEYVEDNL
jgi:hypothetical protein